MAWYERSVIMGEEKQRLGGRGYRQPSWRGLRKKELSVSCEGCGIRKNVCLFSFLKLGEIIYLKINRTVE